jgi:HK97 gp10 family phage protein
MPRLTFTGGKALSAALNQLSTRVSRRLQLEALTEAAEPMRRAMHDKAPVETGRLKKNMVINRSRGIDGQEAAVAVGPARGTFYGSQQEFGNKHHAAQPFARPAFDENADRSLRIIKDALWRELAGKGIQRPMESVAGPVQGEEV